MSFLMNVIVSGETMRLVFTDSINILFDATASIELKLMTMLSFTLYNCFFLYGPGLLMPKA